MPVPAANITIGIDGSFGNEKRGAINGPGFNHLDVGLFRNFKIHEGTSFQLRGEAFNVANHTEFRPPSYSSYASGTFGQISGTYDPRILQLALKLKF